MTKPRSLRIYNDNRRRRKIQWQLGYEDINQGWERQREREGRREGREEEEGNENIFWVLGLWEYENGQWKKENCIVQNVQHECNRIGNTTEQVTMHKCCWGGVCSQSVVYSFIYPCGVFQFFLLLSFSLSLSLSFSPCACLHCLLFLCKERETERRGFREGWRVVWEKKRCRRGVREWDRESLKKMREKQIE